MREPLFYAHVDFIDAPDDLGYAWRTVTITRETLHITKEPANITAEQVKGELLVDIVQKVNVDSDNPGMSEDEQREAVILALHHMLDLACLVFWDGSDDELFVAAHALEAYEREHGLPEDVFGMMRLARDIITAHRLTSDIREEELYTVRDALELYEDADDRTGFPPFVRMIREPSREGEDGRMVFSFLWLSLWEWSCEVLILAKAKAS